MKCSITFKFSASGIDGQFMGLKILAHDQTVFDAPVQETFTVDAQIDFPADIEFHLSNKSPRDTVVQDGKIVADKFIKLESIAFGPVDIESWRIPGEFLNYNGITQQFQNTFWGQNGRAVLSINCPDPIIWLLEHPKTIL